MTRLLEVLVPCQKQPFSLFTRLVCMDEQALSHKFIQSSCIAVVMKVNEPYSHRVLHHEHHLHGPYGYEGQKESVYATWFCCLQDGWTMSRLKQPSGRRCVQLRRLVR